MKFRKKPVVIEAIQYEGKGNFINSKGLLPKWIWDAFESGIASATNGADPFVIKTLEGDHITSPGDWIIQGVSGELYPCKPDIFEKTYEPVIEPVVRNGFGEII